MMKKWLKQGVRYLDSELVDRHMAAEPFDEDTLATYQKMFNVSREELNDVIAVLAKFEQEAVGSMGDDTPMPVLSQTVRSPFDYFRQQFAQVTNRRYKQISDGKPACLILGRNMPIT
jgi:glutamate synthase (NADPH/NADH) large chain